MTKFCSFLSPPSLARSPRLSRWTLPASLTWRFLRFVSTLSVITPAEHCIRLPSVQQDSVLKFLDLLCLIANLGFSAWFAHWAVFPPGELGVFSPLHLRRAASTQVNKEAANVLPRWSSSSHHPLFSRVKDQSKRSATQQRRSLSIALRNMGINMDNLWRKSVSFALKLWISGTVDCIFIANICTQACGEVNNVLSTCQ